MKSRFKYFGICIAVLILATPVFAQSVAKVSRFAGMWQVTGQRSGNRDSSFALPRNHDFKLFDSLGNFRHILYYNGRYMELSHGKIMITSDSTYTELLENIWPFLLPGRERLSFGF
ncbi:hypothetical protein GCM10027051_26910 [Niabella terrae]